MQMRVLERLGAQPQDLGGVGVEMKRRLDQRQPGVLGRGRQLGGEAPCALQSAVDDGGAAAHLPVVPGEEGGHARRLDRLVALTPQHVRALARRDRRVDIVLPPARHRIAIKRVRPSRRASARS